MALTRIHNCFFMKYSRWQIICNIEIQTWNLGFYHIANDRKQNENQAPEMKLPPPTHQLHKGKVKV